MMMKQLKEICGERHIARQQEDANTP